MGHGNRKMDRRTHDHSLLKKGGLAVSCAALVFTAILIVKSPRRKADAAKPNVILIVIDALRADHLGQYGYDRNTDVGFRLLASNSTRFTDAYAPSSWTKPSTASILSGLQPMRHGARGFNDKLPRNVQTIARALKAGGWTTGGFSFNHHISHKTGFNIGFHHFDSFLGEAELYPDISVMLERARLWIRKAGRKPFFLYLHPMNVHGPYKVPEKHRPDLLGRLPSGEFLYFEGLMNNIMTEGEIGKRDSVTPEYVASLRDQYDTAVRYSTDQLGEFFDWLDSRGVFEDSFLIVTSDHGEELFEHGGFSHGYTLFNEVLRVPLYVKLPFQSIPREETGRVSLKDIYPTLMEFFGLPLPYEVDGLSLLPLLSDEAPGPPRREREILFEIEWPDRCVAAALLSDDFKFITISSNYEKQADEILMYDMVSDPGETENIGAKNPGQSLALRQRLESLLREMDKSAVGRPGKPARDLDLERLKSLGYLSPKK